MKLTYSQIVEAIDEVPISHLPGILMRVVQRCAREPVFLPGKLVENVTKWSQPS